MKRRRGTRRKIYADLAFATPEVALLKGSRLRETELLPTLSQGCPLSSPDGGGFAREEQIHLI